jgi:hypothetical protein
MLPLRHALREWNEGAARVLTWRRRKPSTLSFANSCESPLMNNPETICMAVQSAPFGAASAVAAREENAH